MTKENELLATTLKVYYVRKDFLSCFDTDDTSKVKAYLKKTIISCILQSNADTTMIRRKTLQIGF